MKLFQAGQSDAPQVSTFDMSHEVKLSLDMGKLVPILCEETIPGDVWHISNEVFLRMMPTLAPIMHRVDVHVESFFVPNRLVMDRWQEFITGGDHGTAQVPFPVLNYNWLTPGTIHQSRKGSLIDYFGMPTTSETVEEYPGYNFSCLPFRAYQMIWNEFYRDQNLQEPIDIETEAEGELGEEAMIRLTQLRNRNWEKDYFTTCLPTPQKGESVLLPLNGNISASGLDISYVQSGNTQLVGDLSKTDSQTSEITGASGNLRSVGSTTLNRSNIINGDGTFDGNGLPLNVDNSQQLKIDGDISLSSIEGSTSINDLREAFQVQRYLEKLMRGGSRYIEYLKTFWNVKSSDATLQRPQIISANKFPMVISEIPQTSATEDDSVQGTLAGKGISIGKNNTTSYRVEEEGHIIILMSILPKTAYQQGIARKWTRFDRLDYANPTFAHLGEQEVKSTELFFDTSTDGSEPINQRTFGYQSRYAEYKYIPSRVCGDMRDNLDFWHMGRKLSDANSAVLNSQFITADPTTRIFPVTELGNRPVYGQVYNQITCTRKLPYIGEPGMIDHF